MIDGAWTETGWGYTDQDGNYNVGGLTAGTYRIGFDPSQGEYAVEYWDNAVSIATATDVVVGVDGTAGGKDAVLGAASHIAGRVMDGSGTSLSDVEVTAYRMVAGHVDGDRFGPTPTRKATTRSTDSARGPTGSSSTHSQGEYAVEYWDNAATIETATDVVVAAGATATGRNAVLAATVGPSGHQHRGAHHRGHRSGRPAADRIAGHVDTIGRVARLPMARRRSPDRRRHAGDVRPHGRGSREDRSRSA